MNPRRQLYALLMSAVLLPTLLLSPFHHHQPQTENDCVDCAANHPHRHLAQETGPCLICQFLSLPWIASEETNGPAPEWKLTSRTAESVPAVSPVFSILLSTRAPPAVFC